MKAAELQEPQIVRAIAAEGLGTFVFTLLATGTTVATANLTGGDLDVVRLLTISLAFGLSITAVVAATGRVSGGHMNPAVTLAAFIAKKISPTKALAYVMAQLVGASVASLVLHLILLVTSATG